MWGILKNKMINESFSLMYSQNLCRRCTEISITNNKSVISIMSTRIQGLERFILAEVIHTRKKRGSGISTKPFYFNRSIFDLQYFVCFRCLAK